MHLVSRVTQNTLVIIIAISIVIVVVVVAIYPSEHFKVFHSPKTWRAKCARTILLNQHLVNQVNGVRVRLPCLCLSNAHFMRFRLSSLSLIFLHLSRFAYTSRHFRSAVIIVRAIGESFAEKNWKFIALTFYRRRRLLALHLHISKLRHMRRWLERKWTNFIIILCSPYVVTSFARKRCTTLKYWMKLFCVKHVICEFDELTHTHYSLLKTWKSNNVALPFKRSRFRNFEFWIGNAKTRQRSRKQL